MIEKKELVRELRREDVELEDLAKKLRNDYMREWRRKNKEKNKEKYNAYLREWRARNKEKVREYNKRYWLKKAMEKVQI